MGSMSSKKTLALVFHDAPQPDYQRWWTYYPGTFADVKVDNVVKECGNLLSAYRNIYGEGKEVSRKSCVFTSNVAKAKRHLPSYRDILFYLWEDSPITSAIKAEVEERCGHSFDYALFHIYENGSATIAYHNDKESLDGEIASVSVGCRRKFRIRELDQTSGFLTEYELGGGDFLIMKKGMQRLYKHCIPKQLRIKEPRCNWTFRNFPTWSLRS
jgi:alkylated DNA repair dioxygenase AlkB